MRGIGLVQDLAHEVIWSSTLYAAFSETNIVYIYKTELVSTLKVEEIDQYHKEN